jgi:hypothetical protein
MFYCIVAHLSTITLSQLGEDAEVGVGFTYRGSSHHRNGAARHVIDMVRQYRLLSKLGEYCTALNDSVLRLSQGQNMEKLKSSVLVHGLVGGIKSGPKTPAWISLHFL